MPAWLPIAIFAFVIVLIVGITAWQFSEDDAPDITGTDNPFLTTGPADDGTPSYDPEDVPANQGTIADENGTPAAVLSRSGSGAATSSPFTLSGGLLRVHMEHHGNEEGFSVKFLRDGQIEGALAAPSGHFAAYEAERYIPLPEGTYVFEVNADGTWLIELWFPDDEGAITAPGSVGAEGSFVQPPAVLPAGEHTIQFRHFEAGQFEVTIYDANGTILPGSKCQATADPTEPYDRAKTCTIPAEGLYYFDVQAQGRWRISF